MALAGRGAVAIWHDIAPEGRDDFYAWHGSEHMPERAAIPGFLRGRRYVAVHGAPEFFNLYETSSTAVLAGPEYLTRLNAPTPWTRSAVKHFRDVSRSLCDVSASFGGGQGGLVATYRYDMDAADHASHVAAMRARLPSLAKEPGVAGAHLLVADDAASSLETAERRARGSATAVPRWIVLVEGWGDREPFLALASAFAGDAVFARSTIPLQWSAYQLQNTRVATD